jgi:hypothetical protein
VGSAYGKLHSSLAAEFSKRYLAVNNWVLHSMVAGGYGNIV